MVPPVQFNASKDYFYTIKGVQMSVTPFEIDPPICHIRYQCSEIRGKSHDLTCDKLTFDEESGSLSFQTLDMKTYRPGTYTIKIRGSSGFESQLSAEVDLKLTLKNPCQKALFQTHLTSPFQDSSYTIGVNSIEFAFDKNELVKINTLVDCGPIEIDFVDLEGR